MEDSKEMTLQEWCDALPQFHLVNRELRVVKNALNSLLDIYLQYSIEIDYGVELQVKKALEILGDDAP